MLFLKLFYMTAKCKFASVKAINTLGMNKFSSGSGHSYIKKILCGGG